MNTPFYLSDPAVYVPLAIFAVLHLALLLLLVAAVRKQAGKPPLPLWRWLCLGFPYALLFGGLLCLPAGVSFVVAALALIAAPFTRPFTPPFKATSTPDEP